MKRNQKNLLVILILFILVYIYSHSTTYDEFNNDEILKSISLNLKENQEMLVFKSKNPFNFYDILNNLENTSNQTVYGIITYPLIKKEKYPLVMGVAGSLGWSEHHYRYLQEFLDQGIATLSLHSFQSRGIRSTVGEQVSVTIPMVVHDAFSALKALKNINNIDSKKVAITGWSLGGGVALFSAWEPIQLKLSPSLKFAAHLPFYPPCVAKPEVPNFTDSPLHILAGASDNWVPAKPCEELIYELNKLGYNNASITTYDDAHHSFDRESNVVKVDNAYRLEDCSLLLNEKGIVSTNTLISIPMKNGLMQKLGLMFCAEKGPTMGGNKIAREASFEFASNFMIEHLLD